jgi:hypothetical protein
MYLYIAGDVRISTVGIDGDFRVIAIIAVGIDSVQSKGWRPQPKKAHRHRKIAPLFPLQK